LSSLNVSAQMALPAWVRSRGLAVNLAVFFGSMTVGSILWGWLAGRLGIDRSLLIAAAGALVAIAATWRWKLLGSATLDLAPSAHWPVPVTAAPVGDDTGPVLVTVEYEIDPSDQAAFRAEIALLAEERRRDGAFLWQVFTDADDPRRQVEAFMLESWLAHLRQHERVTEADRAVQARVHAFHRGPGQPRVTHLIAR
ncbi:MAG: MFS transporter, partial [Geminicoccaceae bacterium]